MSEQGEQNVGGRYSRTFNGMVGAMVFIVALVVLLGLLRTTISDAPEGGRPPAIDYLDSVQGLQQNDFDVIYPETLPEGWDVTEVSADLGEDPSYRINLYTAEDDFVGVRQESADDVDIEDLLVEFVGEDIDSEDPLVGVGDLAATWEGWSDGEGDLAYSAVVDGQTVLVYGGVNEEALTDLVERLGTTTVATPEPAP